MAVRKHVGYQCNFKAGRCMMCGQLESLSLAGMETADADRADAAGLAQAEEMTAKLLEPLGSIDAKAGRMEMDSPLFYGRIHASLFDD